MQLWMHTTLDWMLHLTYISSMSDQVIVYPAVVHCSVFFMIPTCMGDAFKDTHNPS